MPRRKKLRLPLDAYTKPGAYFITICSQNKRPLFGYFENDILYYQPCGQMVIRYWRRLPMRFIGIGLDKFILMPNHLHGILWIHDIDENQFEGDQAPSIPHVIQWFKSITTVIYCRGVDNDGWTKFKSRLWQRSYYDRVIRSKDELASIRRYIDQNPQRWFEDKYYLD